MTLVLVVDDVPAMAEQYAYDLRRLGGYEVHVAQDGRQALERLGGEPVDCVILDLEMPGMDGFEVLRALERRGSEVPVIVYTGTGNFDRCIQAVRLGALRVHRQGRAGGAGRPGDRAARSSGAGCAPRCRRSGGGWTARARSSGTSAADAAAPGADRPGGAGAEHGAGRRARAERARSWWRASSTGSARIPRRRSSPSTAPRCRST